MDIYTRKRQGYFCIKTKDSIDVKTYTGFTDSTLDNELTDNREIPCIETVQQRDAENIRNFKVGLGKI